MKLWAISLGLLLLFALAQAEDLTTLQPTGYVNDYAKLLSTQEHTQLEAKLVAFEKNYSVEIAVVSVNNMNGDYIEHYSEELFKQWGVGKKGNDTGLLVIASMEERKLRIEVGYGLEPYVTDARANRIIVEDLTPNFKAEKYYEGFDNATDDLMNIIENKSDLTAVTTNALPTSSSPPDWITIAAWIIFILIILFVLPGGSRALINDSENSEPPENTIGKKHSRRSDKEGVLAGAALGYAVGKIASKRRSSEDDDDSGENVGGGFSGGSFGGGSSGSGGGFSGFGGGRSGGGGASGGF